MPQTPSVLLVEDQEMLRLGLRVALDRLGRCQILGEATDGQEAMKEAQRLRPEVVLMDVGLPHIDGIEATWRIKQELPRTRIIMFTSHTSQDDIAAALGAGADGYCGKNIPVEQLANAIDAVMRGEVWLDPEIANAVVRNDKEEANLLELESTILGLIQDGMSNQDIATHLNIAPEKITFIMHTIIGRFIEKTTVGRCEPMQPGSSGEWLTAAVENLNEGKIFADRYLIEDVLGSGATGAVFKAKHLYMDRVVALKLLRPEHSEDRFTMRYFQREAIAIAHLKHENIVGVHDFGISKDGKPFLVMEYVKGTSLAEILNKEKRLTVDRAITLCEQVCAGLIEAHSKGIVHCDLKPSNILIEGSYPNEKVKLVDFGLAQVAPRETTTQSKLTDKFFVSGTPLYMSPEQCAGKQLDARSDIYALGCILYEALTGVNALVGSTAMETLANHCHMIPPPMSAAYPGLFPDKLEQCVSKMLAKDPEARPQSMREVLVFLLAISRQTV